MLNELGVRKRMHADFDREHAAELTAQLRSDVGQLRKERVVSASCSHGVETTAQK
ncbi:hypothetical protein RBA40_24690 [Massilia sp. CCM 9206]|nr:hypothetical protein [Massilia sp. CCM 9206]MDQ1923531.1 hypothetical protein [Massilia sp. CCM 9206]